ncbi:MAG: hypothetical protein ACI4N6_05105 [Eubacteriales bacterium]
MADERCVKCGKLLESDEIALHKKMINRGAKKDFMCIECLGKYFGVTPESLREKIVQLKEMGCTLFDCNKVD